MRLTLVSTVALIAAVSMSCSAQRAGSAFDLGSRLELFIDESLIDKSKNTALRMHPPERKEAVFKFDAPWEGPMSAYVTVLKDGDTFRMYYRGGGETTEEVTCLIESRDGINWTRPKLGLIDFGGSKDNNIIYKGQHKAYWESHNFTPFIDSNPETPKEQRYKALALGRHVLPNGEGVKALAALVSPDGLHWKKLQDEAIITEGSFDSQNIAFWDQNKGEYACYFRVGREGKRSVSRVTSKDFIHWSKPEALDFGNTPLEHFYTNAITPYFREPDVYIGLPMRFVPERKTVGEEERSIDGLSDAVLISSRDGLHFPRRFMEAFIRPGLDAANWGNAHGNNTPVWGIVPISDKEMSVYWCEHYGGVPQVRRGALRTDGFVSVNAPFTGGEFITRPVTFSGKNLVINYSTSAVGSIKVEIRDQNGRPVKGCTIEDCREIYGDEIEQTVRWNGVNDLAFLAGRPVRLRFVMKDADLYSLRFAN